MELFNITALDEDVKRERAKARELRKTKWWKSAVSRGVCYYCKTKVPPYLLTMDHLIPLSQGGKSVKGNIVPACKECNNKKKDNLTFIENRK
jgi:5-methylcytosine-specific restriction endonuclease McrA